MISHLESGGLLLTQNLRQARILRRMHDRAQIAAGREVWPTAQLLPLDSWLETVWREAAASRPELPGLLRPAVVEWLWRQRVERDVPGLIDPAELAAKARASWIRLRAHRGEVADIERWPLTRDQQAFASWAKSVEADLADRQVRDSADLARLIVDVEALPAPGPRILLSGFRQLTGAQSALMAALRARGWTVELDSPTTPPADTWSHAAADPENEQNRGLSWIREQLERRPEGVHGLILPGIAARRGAVERAIAAALQPELELPGTASRDRLFDLAGGQPLLAQPLVETALATIECAREPIHWPTLTRLLRSPHIGGAAAERSARLRLDVDLRSVDPLLFWDAAALSRRAIRAGAGTFAASLFAAIATLRGARRRNASAWAEAFGACLTAWGWPGGVQLDSNEYQAAQAFGERLRELSRLDSVATGFTVTEALREMRRAAAGPFQSERGEPALFVLDSLDDPGIQFDSLWVGGLSAAAWPRPTSVDPLLPIEIQRNLGMPGVTAEDCVAEARAVIERWRAGSRELVLSWPRRENDTDVDGSPLIPGTLKPLPLQASRRNREQLLHDAGGLEPMPADPAPPRLPGAVHGGARVLELQSQCPFRAFAELRLAARPLEEPRAGIDRRMRGTILHRALQGFWSQTRSLAGLLGLDAPAQSARVAACVEEALARELPAETSKRSRLLERDWQCRAMSNLLAIERTRTDFVVAEAERSMEREIGGLALRLQVDRIDRVGDGLLVIDYKTGKASPKQWRGARMDAPQLPLYAVLHPGRPSGVAVATVASVGARFRGVADDAGAISGLQPAANFELTEDRETGFDWRQITSHWYAWLEALARDHAAGRADVDPKLAAATCRNCHLGALCRVALVPPDGPETEETGDEE